MARDFDVTVTLCVVHPAAIRNPACFARMDPLARRYFMADSARAAAFQTMPFRRPIPDPPLATRLGRLGIAATERGQGLTFADTVSRLLWDGSVTGWDTGDHRARAAGQAGLDLNEMEAAIAVNPAHHDAKLAQNDASLRAAGHWGVPTMVFALPGGPERRQLSRRAV